MVKQNIFSCCLALLCVLVYGPAADAQSSQLPQVSVQYMVAPLFKGLPHNPVLRIRLGLNEAAAKGVEKLEVYANDPGEPAFTTRAALLAQAAPSTDKTLFPVQLT